jgi:hypothetical protein
LITEVRNQASLSQCAVLGLVPRTACGQAVRPATHVLGIPLSKVGFPIRKSTDQSFFAAPRGLSQRSTSFIASQRQGIHQMPLSHLIALIINAHAPRRCPTRSLHFLQTDTDLERPVCFTRSIQRHCGQASPTIQLSDSKSQTSEFLPISVPVCRSLNGDSAHPVTHVTWSAWINLLFTMSDNTRAAAEACDVRIHFSQRTRLQSRLVEPDGIEPTTSCLQSRRSPN